jgi:hypothetical protein
MPQTGNAKPKSKASLAKHAKGAKVLNQEPRFKPFFASLASLRENVFGLVQLNNLTQNFR